VRVGINVVHRDEEPDTVEVGLHPVYRFNQTNHYTPAVDEPSPFYAEGEYKHWMEWKRKLTPGKCNKEIRYVMHSLIRWLISEPERYPEILGSEAPKLLTSDGKLSLGWVIYAKYACPEMSYQQVHEQGTEFIKNLKQPETV